MLFVGNYLRRLQKILLGYRWGLAVVDFEQNSQRDSGIQMACCVKIAVDILEHLLRNAQTLLHLLQNFRRV